MKPISKDKRELIIAAKKRGEKEDCIAFWLSVSKRTVGTIWRLYKSKGNVLPVPYKGRISRLKDSQIDEIRAEMKKNPDITLNELIVKLSLPIKKSRLSKLLIKLDYSYKKRLFIRKDNSDRTFKRSALSGAIFKKD